MCLNAACRCGGGATGGGGHPRGVGEPCPSRVDWSKELLPCASGADADAADQD